MKRTLTLCFLVLCQIPLLKSCAPKKGQIDYPITLQKSGCKGRCPIYEASLFKDGQLLFQGRAHTAHIGLKRIQLSTEAYKSLEKIYNRIDFENIDTEFDRTVFD